MNAVTAKGIYKIFRLETPRSDVFSALIKFLSGHTPRRPFTALENISFELVPGKILALCGPNGSGKTTLLKVLAGILRPTSGSVSLAGKKACLLGFSSILQDRLTVEDNARLCAVFFELEGPIRKNTSRLLEEAGLEEFRQGRMGDLSSGMRIRLPFMAALNSGASVFLVDEALAVGDAAFQQKCLDKFRGLKAAGAAIVLATHNLKLAETLADEVLLLAAGRQLFKGPFKDMPQGYDR
ncbi:MAG: hypothetical protein A2021_01190 [Elusimicrobia bacterium GWF2_52_66]|nr:MAG: hypothetical protein A2X33_06045 [Elusimicrobia bacterium GWA2_51_34]OGR88208.1 MAG: hypothetical protein A2021_01190 [Elusimicrobia bacterium GWF2_52_66]HAF95413.1 hypothetical protein [Elusimicrobiota bacterium]HCE98723.1 hypothetical protein [Elusimicrobiota bacterium]